MYDQTSALSQSTLNLDQGVPSLLGAAVSRYNLPEQVRDSHGLAVRDSHGLGVGDSQRLGRFQPTQGGCHHGLA